MAIIPKLYDETELLAQQMMRRISDAQAQQANGIQWGMQDSEQRFSPAMGTLSASTQQQSNVMANRAREMFLKRMGGIRAEMRIASGDFLQCHIYGEVVHVFFCFGGKPGVTQESIDLFPSDTLIAQFRMILA